MTLNMGSIGGALKNVFIAHEGNGHKPHLLRPRTVAFVCLIAIVAEAGFLLAETYVVPHSKFFGIIEANALVDETNAARETSGLSDLAISPLLTAAAQDKVNDMVANDYFAHTSPAGLTPWYWFEKVGYAFSYAGENLAVNFSDSQDVTNAWLNSPEHRANIMNGDFTQIGIATAQGTYNGQPAIYVAEEFGTPASVAVAFLNSASAASGAPATSPATSTQTTQTQTQPQKVTAPISSQTLIVSPAPAKTATKPSGAATGVKTTTKAVTVPAVVASSSNETSSSAQSFLAVAGAAQGATGTPETSTAVTGVAVEASNPAPATTSAVAGGTASPQSSGSQVNPVQRLLADPRALANDFYLAIIAIFAAAIVINMFVNIRIKYPHLILGGMIVVVVAGLLVLFNQDLGVLHAIVL